MSGLLRAAQPTLCASYLILVNTSKGFFSFFQNCHKHSFGSCLESAGQNSWVQLDPGINCQTLKNKCTPFYVASVLHLSSLNSLFWSQREVSVSQVGAEAVPPGARPRGPENICCVDWMRRALSDCVHLVVDRCKSFHSASCCRVFLICCICFSKWHHF